MVNTNKQEYLEIHNTKKFLKGLAPINEGIQAILPGINVTAKYTPKGINADFTIYNLEEEFNKANTYYTSFQEFIKYLKEYGILFDSYTVQEKHFNFKFPQWYFDQTLKLILQYGR